MPQKHHPVVAGMKIFAASMAIFVLLPSAGHAQPFPESSRQKTQEEQKKASDKATEEAYKAYMKRTPDSDKKVDPWGNLRAPSAGK
jgi:hypothetical protein